jgi:exodeoxyribonuclease VII small subunit
VSESANPTSAGTSARVAPRPVGEMKYEELVAELSAVTQSMDNGAIGIEEVAKMYRRASELHATATQRLAEVSARIEQLQGGSGS